MSKKSLYDRMQELNSRATLQRMVYQAERFNFDRHNQDDLKSLIGSCAVSLALAIDDGRISFKEGGDDELLLVGLLAVNADFALDGNLKKVFD